MRSTTMTEPRADAAPSVADALHHDADALFTRHSVRDVEAYSAQLLRLSDEKKRAARALVGDRYQELLGVAKTVVSMQTSLASLRGTLAALDTGIEQHSARASDRASRLATAALPDCPARPLLACALLLRDAPAIAEAALARGALLHAAWGVFFGDAAAAHLAAHAPHATELAEITHAQASLQRTRAAIVTHATSRLTQDAVGNVLAALTTLVVLGEQTPAEGLAYFHAERYAQIRTRLHDPTHDAHGGMQAIAECYAQTLAHTRAIFAPHGKPSPLHTALDALGDGERTSRFYALGAPMLGDHAASIYAHLPPAVVHGTPPAPRLPSAAEVDEACGRWSARVCADLDTLSTRLCPVEDLDAVAACRAELRATMQQPDEHAALQPALDALHARFASLLDARAVQLVEQTLQATAASFRDAVQAGLASAAAHDAPLFPPAPAALEACTLVETHLARAARHAHVYGHAASEPLARTCEQIAAYLAEAATDDAPALAYLIRLSRRLHARVAPALQESVPDWSGRLAQVSEVLQRRWAAVEVERALAAGRAERPDAAPDGGAQISRALRTALGTLSRAQLRLHTDAPDTLPAFARAWTSASAFDAAFLQHLQGAPATPEVAAEAARLRLMLAPWTLASRGVPAERVRPPTVPVAPVAPRIPPL